MSARPNLIARSSLFSLKIAFRDFQFVSAFTKLTLPKDC